jgi:hypothetical protein
MKVNCSGLPQRAAATLASLRRVTRQASRQSPAMVYSSVGPSRECMPYRMRPPAAGWGARQVPSPTTMRLAPVATLTAKIAFWPR